MPSLHPAWRIVGLVLAVVFLGLAAGLLERARNPVAFWLSALGLVLMGLYLLADDPFRATEERR
jgi:hypothetical protein